MPLKVSLILLLLLLLHHQLLLVLELLRRESHLFMGHVRCREHTRCGVIDAPIDIPIVDCISELHLSCIMALPHT